MNETLSHDTLQKLREQSIITENEVAIKFGDKFIAENVITKERRLIDVPTSLIEQTKRVLKG